jgi:hypothetical protein
MEENLSGRSAGASASPIRWPCQESLLSRCIIPAERKARTPYSAAGENRGLTFYVPLEARNVEGFRSALYLVNLGVRDKDPES